MTDETRLGRYTYTLVRAFPIFFFSVLFSFLKALVVTTYHLSFGVDREYWEMWLIRFHRK